MFLRKTIDYSIMPLGKITKQGSISICERCGKRGAYIKFPFPQGQGYNGYLEKWHHFEEVIFLSHGSEASCVRTVRAVNDHTVSDWGWSD